MNEFTGNYLTHCPTPNCEFAFIDDNPQPQRMHCPQCAHEYCSHCAADHRAEVTCQQAREERELTPQERQNRAWIANNTKQCPNEQCRWPIEKNNGCNHMTCNQCRTHFCWLCLSPWDMATYRCTSDACRHNQIFRF